MKTRLFAAVSVLFAAAAGRAQDTNPAMTSPDRFAWEKLFVPINKPSGAGQNAVWETWASDDDTFPLQPDPAKPPTWPAAPSKTLRPLRQLQIRDAERTRAREAEALLFNRVLPKIAPQGGDSEVRRNQPAFKFIVGSKLFYLEGLMAAAANGTKVSFPPESIEIKAKWKSIAETDKPRFHWNTDAQGHLFGLIALHISSKDIPNWVWATFEHIDNPDRCKVLGCRDSFGVRADGKVSPELVALFKANKMGVEWQNYRLDGVQVDFTDSTGVPSLLGSSILEQGFVGTSSCTTCHARAAIDSSGDMLAVFAPMSQSYNGTPGRNWFYTTSLPPKPLNLQLDFVWAFLAANPAKR
jgi:hypothetical protein